MDTLYLIDGPNMAHRAAATGELRPQLEAMLRRFLRVAAPRYVVAIWDDRQASFRRDLWPGYKADRHHPMDVSELMKDARQVFSAFEVPCISGFWGAEADDLMATIASKAPPEIRVVLLSADKDLFQLLDERTFLAVRRGGKSLLYRAEDVEEKYGIEPHQWPAAMALAGAKNGVPGLKGIGLKGACSLLAKYGDLETLVRRCRTIPRQSYRHALEGHAAEARLYLQLMTLKRDLPIGCRLTDWQRRASG